MGSLILHKRCFPFIILFNINSEEHIKQPLFRDSQKHPWELVTSSAAKGAAFVVNKAVLAFL